MRCLVPQALDYSGQEKSGGLPRVNKSNHIRDELRRLIPLGIWILLVGTGTLGAILAVASFLAGSSSDALNAALIPINLLPATVFLIWLKAKGELDHSMPEVQHQQRDVLRAQWPAPRSLAGKPLAGFRATPDRRIIVLCGMIVSVIRFKNPLLHR